MIDKQAMKKAWEMANKCEPSYKFGCAIVKDGKIIAADHNHVGEIPDTSAHAEVSAIRQACKVVEDYILKGCTLYSTHEPCIMCFSCAMWAGVEKVVYQVPKEDQDDFMYASNMSIEDFNRTALRSKIRIERYNKKTSLRYQKSQHRRSVKTLGLSGNGDIKNIAKKGKKVNVRAKSASGKKRGKK